MLFVLLLLLSSPLDENRVGYEIDQREGITTLSFTSFRNLIIIPAVLNDRIKLSLILDTGTRSLILFGSKTKKLNNIIKERNIKVNGRGELGAQDALLSFPNKIVIGNIVGNGVGAAVIVDSAFENAISGVDGIIGYELFVKFCIKIDYPNKLITFYNTIPMGASSEFREMKLNMSGTRPEITATIQFSKKRNVQSNMLIDTGSSFGLLLFAVKTGNVPAFGREQEIGMGFSGNVTATDAYVRSCKIGGVELYPKHSKTIFVSNQEKSNLVTSSLGGDFLKNYVVMFHYPSSTFFISG